MLKKLTLSLSLICLLVLGMMPVVVSTCLTEHCEIVVEVPVDSCACSHDHVEEPDVDTELNLSDCHHECGVLEIDSFYSDARELSKAKANQFTLAPKDYFSLFLSENPPQTIDLARFQKPCLPPPHLEVLAVTQLLI